MSNFRVDMGNRMKERRKQLHYTQEYMAEKLNVSLKHYGGVERGNAGLSLENMVEVSEILGVGLDYLIKGTEENNDFMPERMKEIYLSFPQEKRQHIMEMLEAVSKL